VGKQRKRRRESCMKQEHSNAYSLYWRRRRRRRREVVNRHGIGASGGTELQAELVSIRLKETRTSRLSGMCWHTFRRINTNISTEPTTSIIRTEYREPQNLIESSSVGKLLCSVSADWKQGRQQAA
jgi:hypothetical protein